MKTKLYRGDSIRPDSSTSEKGKTFSDYYCENGLMAKYADGGRSGLLANKNSHQLASEHVGYTKNSAAQKLSFRSPMLSFTSSKERAFEFCERISEKRDRLIKCEYEDATHFLYDLALDLPKPTKPGLYEFEYFADPINCREIAERMDQHARRTEDCYELAMAIQAKIVQDHAEEDNTHHNACLIEVCEFLSGNPINLDQETLINARFRAERDHEWLLFPCDSMPGGNGVSSRFHMNTHLKVTGFRIRDMN